VTGLEPEIKWVNDLYIKGKKICGILTEAAADFETGNIDYIVLGAGINFTEPKQGFPEELRSVAGALFKAAPDGQLRSRLAAGLVNSLSRLTCIPDPGAVMADYRKHSMVIGKPVTILSGRETLEGVVSDINDAGHLILKKDDGTFQSIVSGEVSLRLR
ncbi:MAG: biotin--[acetyl-CoA-carboxylase] ligase, partial [Eubacterium limosum]|nr:biotin--[acetyl-CoA-carboxylase] ligase [Eubacterium limosum]